MGRPKSQGSPLMVKNLENCQIVGLDSSKEVFSCSECNVKLPSSLQSTISEKNQEKLAKIAIFEKKL